ncbi:C40 family peptidase [Panacagrimonas sp.]|uniref:C40 family peptidase n=1 Tax=Panacagrimonas sp. TaxID=2480088 RepID=UPI003B51FC25
MPPSSHRLFAALLLCLAAAPALASIHPDLRMSPVLFASAPQPGPETRQAPLVLRPEPSLRSGLIRAALTQGQAMLGTDYLFGADREDAVDCSSLVQRMFRAVGLKMPRTTRQQVKLGRAVRRDQVIAGDLLFYRFGPSGLHVAVYLDDNKVLHASTGEGEVVVSELTRAWDRRLVAARRLL